MWHVHAAPSVSCSSSRAAGDFLAAELCEALLWAPHLNKLGRVLGSAGCSSSSSAECKLSPAPLWPPNAGQACSSPCQPLQQLGSVVTISHKVTCRSSRAVDHQPLTSRPCNDRQLQIGCNLAVELHAWDCPVRGAGAKGQYSQKGFCMRYCQRNLYAAAAWNHLLSDHELTI